MLQKKRSINVNCELEEIKKELSSKYSYTKSIKNGRIILNSSRVKFVQIINTKEDLDAYQMIMKQYIEYVKNNYSSSASSDGCDMAKCFIEETAIENGKLPMFFVYNKQDKLLGMAGIRTNIIAELNNKKIPMQEVSVRIVGETKDKTSYGYGALVYLILHLYMLNNNVHFFAKTYFQKRDFWFHLFDKVGVHYIKTEMLPRSFLSEKIKMDIFADIKNIKID